MAESYYSTSSYAYVLNNPIKLIDPNGMFAAPPTDYYNTKGKKIASDGVNNGEKKMVLTKASAKKVKKEIKKHGVVKSNLSDVIRVHSNQEVAAMEQAYNDTEKPTSDGKRYEKGFVGGVKANGDVVMNTMAQGKTKPNGTVLVDPTSAEASQTQAGASIEYEVHSHPYHADDSGTYNLSYGAADPSPADVTHQGTMEKSNSTKYSIILGYRNNGGTRRIGFYNSSGTLNVGVDFKKYKKATKKINSK